MSLFAAYAAFLLLSLPQYGPTWDELYEYPRATAFVAHVFGQDQATMALPWHVLGYDDARASTWNSANACLPSLLPAASGLLLHEQLGWLGCIDAYHLPLVLMWLGFLCYFHAALVSLHGARVALVATVLLALTPRVISDVPNNMKDIPAMAFGTAALLELARGVVSHRPGRGWSAGLMFACAVSCKFTAVIVVVPALTLLWLGFRGGSWWPRLPRRWWLPLSSVPVLTAAVLIGHWPYLWAPPAVMWERLLAVFRVGDTRIGAHASWYPLVMAAITTPLVTLGGLAAAVLSPRRGTDPDAPARTDGGRMLMAFLWVWVLSVLAVFSSGLLTLFDGVRHFLLFLPPVAVLAAIGLLRICDALRRRAGLAAALALALAGNAVPIALYHPYAVTYFNALIGGLPGATQLDFGESVLEFEPRDYWATSVRACMRWVDANAPAGACVFVSLPPMFGALQVYPLRPGLRQLAPDQAPPGSPRYLVFPNRRRWFGDAEKAAIATGELVHQEEARGVPLSFVYRLRQ